VLDACIDDPLINKIEKEEGAGEAYKQSYQRKLYGEMQRKKDVEEKQQDADQQ
jgi:hypothetical protein